MSDWGKNAVLLLTPAVSLLTIRAEGSDDDSRPRPIRNNAIPKKGKWEGEDEDNDEPVVSPA